MKTSINWLKTYIDIPREARELAERLTLAGLEVEGIEEIGTVPEGIVVAEILSRDPHPNADRLSVCQVSTGSGEPLRIVCGAPNCDAGSRVPLAGLGVRLSPDFVIGKVKLRGVESCGMLCSARELGLSDDHSGLLQLPADAPVGAPLEQVLHRDTVIDWEVTPNRPDWLSHIGIAREIAAVNGAPESLRLPDTNIAEAEGTRADDVTSVHVGAPDLCPRYTARIIRDLTVGPSPEWMQRALSAVGVRPINNVVDITNFVMLEYGQPLHAFDYDELAEGRIVVRRAADGETITTLDEQEHELTADQLLICDGARGVALAGVMGGANSEISDRTTTVLLESACFNATNIRATARRLGISTDSSYRFERGVDIEGVEAASRRAAALMASLAGGVVLAGSVDEYAAPYSPPEVSCRFERIDALLGVAIAPEAVASYLTALGLRVVSQDAAGLTVSIPSYRPDLVREVDLIEEIARLHGLDRIPAAPAIAAVGGTRADDRYYLLETARAQLRGLGLDETMTYSFTSAEAATRSTGIAEGQLVGPSNPLSSEIAVMRPSLLPSLLQTVAYNVARNCHDLGFFELGRVIVDAPDTPEERNQIGIAMTGRAHGERFAAEKETAIDFFDLKGVVEGWFAARRLDIDVAPTEHPAFRPGCAAAVTVQGRQVAVLGEVCEELTADIRLRYPVHAALVELDSVAACEAAALVHRALPQFPAVGRDVSLVAPSTLSHRDIVGAINSLDIPLLEQVELFDIYEDADALGEGRRSLAYSMTYRSAEQTLTDKQVNKAHEKVRRGLVAKLGVELR